MGDKPDRWYCIPCDEIVDDPHVCKFSTFIFDPKKPFWVDGDDVDWEEWESVD